MAENNVFNRPMFRIPSMGNNQPGGIMASGPNIMKASFAVPKEQDATKKKILSKMEENIKFGGLNDPDPSQEKSLKEIQKDNLLKKFQRKSLIIILFIYTQA